MTGNGYLQDKMLWLQIFALLHTCRSSWALTKQNMEANEYRLNLKLFCSKHNTHMYKCTIHCKLKLTTILQPKEKASEKRELPNHNANKTQVEGTNCGVGGFICLIFSSINALIHWPHACSRKIGRTNYDGGFCCCCLKYSCMAEWRAWFGVRWWCARGNFVIGDVVRPLSSQPFMTSAS